MNVEVISLPRGGTLVKTPSGTLQVGAPPETIKDTIKILGDVPDTFVIPNSMFSAEYGVSLADIEFPAYFNFFIKRRSMRIIGTQYQLETIFRVFSEAILGPDNIHLTREYPFGMSREMIPNLRAEMEYLRASSLSGKRKAELDDMITGVQWGVNGRVPFGNIAIEHHKDFLRLVDRKQTIAEVSLNVNFESVFHNKTVSRSPFKPPIFGVTVIGSGSGFDPDEMTSGFIIWINHRGILVDPPVDSTYWLKTMGIDFRLIDGCILTHCHADHDSGILQKLLEEKKINLYTTETVMESFSRKYQSLIGLNGKTFMNLFHFHPITLQVPICLGGGEFRFFYTLHSVPTIGFEIFFQGKSFVYSSDSVYDPATFKKMFESGYISRHRMVELMNFPWHHSVIFHEAGTPPLHTPMKNLVDLPEDVKSRIYLIHVNQKSIPVGSKLRKVPDGRDDTLIIDVAPLPSNDALRYLAVLNQIDLFSELPIEKAREFLTLIKVENYKTGDLIVRENTVSNRFFIIVNGQAISENSNGDIVTRYGANDYIGEVAILLNLPSITNVFAETDMEILIIDRYDFLYFIRDSKIGRRMKIIAQNQEYDTQSLFDDSNMLKLLSVSQRNNLKSIMSRVVYQKGDFISVQGAYRDGFFLIDSGIISIIRNQKYLMRGGRGSFLARIYSPPRESVYRFSIIAESDVVLYAIESMEFYSFLEKNPGVFLFLRKSKIRDCIQVPKDL